MGPVGDPMGFIWDYTVLVSQYTVWDLVYDVKIDLPKIDLPK